MVFGNRGGVRLGNNGVCRRRWRSAGQLARYGNISSNTVSVCACFLRIVLASTFGVSRLDCLLLSLALQALLNRGSEFVASIVLYKLLSSILSYFFSNSKL